MRAWAAAVAGLAMSLGWLAPAAASVPHADAPVRLEAQRSCTAPEPPSTNACTVGGVAPLAADDGTPVRWEVTALLSDRWRVQFQAFSEGASGECQYPIRVAGSVGAAGVRSDVFVSTSGFELDGDVAGGLSVTLHLDWLQIDLRRPNCGSG